MFYYANSAPTNEIAIDQLSLALGKRIREKRKGHGVSQDTLGLSCGLDRSYLGRIERGEVNVSIEKLYRIALTLGCQPAEFLPPLALFVSTNY